MDISTIIEKKRRKRELTKDEIKYFVGKYTKDEISDSQAAALFSYIYEHGLTEEEMLNFIKELSSSGDMLDLTGISRNIVNKHSTGGIGDKVILILMPIIASLGYPVAEVSSKSCEVFAGPLEKLSAIPGFNSNITIKEFMDNVSNIGISIISQDFNLAPAEEKLEKLRNEIACKDSEVLTAISLMSLKLAAGSNKIAFDLICGNGSTLKDRAYAKKLGRLLVRLGNKLDKQIGYMINEVDEPIGKTIGNDLEIKEVVRALNNEMTDDVRESVEMLGSIVLYLVRNERSIQVNSARIEEAIKSGKALEKFKQMVANQGGDVEYINNIDKFKPAQNILPVYATKDGFVSEIDCEIVTSISEFLGIGKTNDFEDNDNSTGIVFEKKVGDEVKVGEAVAYIHSNDEDKALRATKVLGEGYRISNVPIRKTPGIVEIYGI